MRSANDILGDLAEVVRRTFPDRDFPDMVDLQTRAFADLGLASIDLVVLAERLDAHYGRRLPFGAFLKGLRDCGANDLELGELVNFLQQQVG
ncbi:MAG: acyl carrier protein [Planctomycetia bacterium]|nr:acyl carrier protein [Planctomycetia bacterium]